MFDPKKDTIGFGVHKGTAWIDIPEDYLEWVKENGRQMAIKSNAKITLGILQKNENSSKDKENEKEKTTQECSRSIDDLVLKELVGMNQTLMLIKNLLTKSTTKSTTKPPVKTFEEEVDVDEDLPF